MAAQKLDPKALPSKSDERHRISRELLADARQAMARNESLVASLALADALMLFPSDPEILDTFGRLAGSVPDALALFPVATGAIHVATAAARARVLAAQRRLPDALDLLGKVLSVAPDLAYYPWAREWLAGPALASVPWDLVNDAIFVPSFRMLLRLPMPLPADDPRVANVRAVIDLLRGFLAVQHTNPKLYLALAIASRRLSDFEGSLAVARDGAQRAPKEWGLHAAAMNALCDLKRPDEAMPFARAAVALDPKDASPLRDLAHGYLAAKNPQRALALLEEVRAIDPAYPGLDASMHYARFMTTQDPAARAALLHLRDRRPWDHDVTGLADELDPPVPFVNVLPSPGDAASSYASEVVGEIRGVMACCGRGAKLEMTVTSRYPESPSAPLAFDHAMRALGAAAATMTVEIEGVQNPDPRADKGQVPMPVYRFDGQTVSKVHPSCPDPRAQQAVGSVAYLPFRKDTWDASARQIAQSAGPAAAPAILSVITNPPAPPPDLEPVDWTYRCQIAAAVLLSHMGPWEGGPARAALYSLVSGPSDWVTIAGIVAMSWRAGDSPALRAEVENTFRWLRSRIPAEGFTPWEYALVESWRALGNHAPEVKADLDKWLADFERTVESKNSVRTQRRYAGRTIEEYARFCVERDRISPVSYAAGAAFDAAFSPAPALVALCQTNGIDPRRPFVVEWQEALNANPALMDKFIDTCETMKLEALGVSSDEKGALDRIRDGNMDMHQRMAQAQSAQRTAGSSDPDPTVFPGQRVAKLSDYVKILKGMQSGNMMGALGAYGLDMMAYGTVAQAWAAKMAADPELTEKFSRMMAG